MQYSLTELEYHFDPLPRLAGVRALGHPVLLDSAAAGSKFGRYSILSAGPADLIQPEESESGSQTLFRLRTAIHALGAATWPAGAALPFGAGALGFITYDFARQLESLPERAKADIRLPALQMGIYAWSLISDHQDRRCWLVCHPSMDDQARAKVKNLLEQPQAPGSFCLNGGFTADQTRWQYQAAFDRVQQYILSGDTYQINLAQRFQARCSGDPLGAYSHLRQACPTPFSAYVENADAAILCHSPERFLRLADDQVETRPIKGTRARSIDLEKDAALAEDLRTSVKDRAENVMIVDLLRNDLGRTCALGSVKVPELFNIETYPNVHHLVSSVTGTLQPQKDALDLLAGAFPGGSITGAPKIRAMQIIEELEPVRRSMYCGSLGFIGCEGQMDLNIAIRTLVHQDDNLYLWGGGGVVADSQVDAEYQETLTKVSLLMDALAIL